jgi:hypothetical protein
VSIFGLLFGDQINSLLICQRLLSLSGRVALTFPILNGMYLYFHDVDWPPHLVITKRFQSFSCPKITTARDFSARSCTAWFMPTVNTSSSPSRLALQVPL